MVTSTGFRAEAAILLGNRTVRESVTDTPSGPWFDYVCQEEVISLSNCLPLYLYALSFESCELARMVLFVREAGRVALSLRTDAVMYTGTKLQIQD